MKRASFAVFTLSVLLSASAFAASVNYKIIDRIKVRDGGFDYATFDAATGRVLMARTNFTTVIYAKTGKLSLLESGARSYEVLVISP